MVSKIEDLVTLTNIKDLIKLQKKIKTVYSYERLKGEGYGFYYSPETKQFAKIKRGRTVTRLVESCDEKGRYLVYAENQYFFVPKEELEDIGFY